MNFEDEKKYLAVDIGSNAMRASVAILDHANDLEVIETFRYPLRLGGEAFTQGEFSPGKIKQTTKAFHQLKDAISAHELEDIKVVATSAVRDSRNSDELISKVKDKVGFDIEVINGELEADLIQKAIGTVVDLSEKKSLLVDIGGGSTEFSLVENESVVFSTSYPCGTLRFLEEQKASKLISEIDAMTDDLKSKLDQFNPDHTQYDLCIGTGGNLRRMGKLRNLFFNRSAHKITQQELSAIKIEVAKLSLRQRVIYLTMREDRADVIVPAMEIIESLLIKFELPEILLPNVGLKEGIFIDQIGDVPRNIILN
ncbi:MAG: hypothetical protein CME62_11960 [Halobacteriovoraceae bacterium]|nr:hypothetical protein [Halobacteriovoraceae bacterium]|tara:strand:- start:24070 stop:25005 length:936 start_codon:yes stop_codon:yes gene_type:complete